MRLPLCSEGSPQPAVAAPWGRCSVRSVPLLLPGAVSLSGMARRALSTASIGWSSSITFATLGTAITTLVLVPGLNVLFTVLLGADLAANDTVRIGCATALIATLSPWQPVLSRALPQTGGLASSSTCARRARWMLDTGSVRRRYPRCWHPVTGLSNVGIDVVTVPHILRYGSKFRTLVGAILLMPVAVLGGVCLEHFAAGLGLYLSDPVHGVRIFCRLFCQ